MTRRRLVLLFLGLAIALLWAPVIKPAGKAAILLLDIYSESLVGRNVARLITPEPLVFEERATLGGVEMRVTWWRPGWGDAHPGLLIVPGASPLGNDNEALRGFGASIARAGYMVMLPEFPFLKEGRFDPGATRQLDAAYALFAQRNETRGRAIGTFGVSVGGGQLICAAAREPALGTAAFIAVLGAYFDIDTYLASVVGGQQVIGGQLTTWTPSAEARERLPEAAVAAVGPGERDAVRHALAASTYEEVLRRLRVLPAPARAIYEALSPRTVWSRVRPPVFWMHDPADTFEPLAEAENAATAPRDGRLVLVVPRLVSHAAAETGAAKEQGPLFVAGELWRLLSFTFEVLRLAG